MLSYNNQEANALVVKSKQPENPTAILTQNATLQCEASLWLHCPIYDFFKHIFYGLVQLRK